MNLKQFLKPDWRKIVIFFIVALLWLLLTFFLVHRNLLRLPDVEIIKIGYPAFFTKVTPAPGFGPKRSVWNFLNLVVNIAIWYLFACFIIWIYDKVKKKS